MYAMNKFLLSLSLLLILLGVVLNVLEGFWIGFIPFFIGLVVLVTNLIIINSKKVDNADLLKPMKNNFEILETKHQIPEICPHCKNPNTKNIRLCEWCGNQIC
jgi:hypothetical protein